MIHLPLMVIGTNEYLVYLSVIIKTIIHAWIDDEKANKLHITLFEDQIMHGIQIVSTWALLTL